MIIRKNLTTLTGLLYNQVDDNFDFLENQLPKKFDIIYLDSLHEAKHVEKFFITILRN